MFDPQIPYNDLPLISSITIEVDQNLQKLLEDTRVSIEVLSYALKALPNPKELIDMLALQEARVSSNIENIYTTNEDLYKSVALDEFTSEAKEITDYKEALLKGFELINEKGSFSLTDLEKLNSCVNLKAHGIRANLPNFGTLTRITKETNFGKEIIYTPPHGKEFLQMQLFEMLDFVYNDEIYDMHPLLKIALAHCQFENIHPFYDGNGRTGRILNILLLCQKKYLTYPVLYASSYIVKNKNEYYDLLRTSKETGDYKEAVIYMLNSFKETAKKTLYIVEQINLMIKEYTTTEETDSNRDNKTKKRYFLDSIKGNQRALCGVIPLVMKKPYTRICDLVPKYANRQTAAVYLDRLTEAGILSKEKVGRENIYKNIKLFELFEK